MNKLFKLTAIIFFITCIFSLTSCKNKYTVTFKDYDGTILKKEIVEEGSAATRPTNPTKEGYMFDGWYLNEEKWIFIGYKVTEDITLEARFSPITYNITYELNGGTSRNPLTYTIEDEIKLTNPTKEGYTFIGWTTDNCDIPYLDMTITHETEDKHFIANFANLTFNLKETNEYEITGYVSNNDTEIIIPTYYNGIEITSIREKAFDSCTAEIILDNSAIKEIGYKAFYNYRGTSITIPNDVLSIGESAFERCYNLTNVTFEENSQLTSIGTSAFYNCSSLKSIELPDNLTSIGNYVFYWCESLLNIEIPKNVTNIGASAFYYCANLTNIEIPNGVTNIGEFAFSHTSLTKIKIPNSVLSIGENAFDYCFDLVNITFEENSQLTSIGSHAFSWCISLENIEIPNSVTIIGENAFSICINLKIYCHATSKPSGWNPNWNPDDLPVVWGYLFNNWE